MKGNTAVSLAVLTLVVIILISILADIYQDSESERAKEALNDTIDAIKPLPDRAEDIVRIKDMTKNKPKS
ncbi:MAG: hypothetical protein ABIC95_00485 [archaeon]